MLGHGGSRTRRWWVALRFTLTRSPTPQSLAGLPQAASRLLTSHAVVARTGCTGSRNARHHRANRHPTHGQNSLDRVGDPRPTPTAPQGGPLSRKERTAQPIRYVAPARHAFAEGETAP